VSALPNNITPFRRRAVTDMTGDAEERRPSPGDAYVKVPVAILQVGLSAGAFYTYCWLQRHDGERGCFPSLTVLAGEMLVGERSIRRYLDELERAGFVRAETRRGVGGGGSLPTAYLLFPNGDAPTNRPDSDDEPAIMTASCPDEPAKNVRRTGQKRRDEPAKNDVRINVELEPVNKNQGTRNSKAAADRPIVQATLIEPDTAVVVVLDALSLTGAVSVRAVTAIVAAFPTVNHALAAACCAEWCANKRRKPSAATYRNWCAKEANGASDEENPGGAGPGRTGGAARARPANSGRPANPQHAAHAAKLDW
jgi:hypothetical protein